MSVGNLPSGWGKTSLGDVTHAKVEQVDRQGTLTYIDIGSVDNLSKQIAEPRLLGKTEKIPSRARQLLAAGDVLVSMTRPNLNAVAIVPPEFDGAIGSTGFDFLRAIEVEPKWLFNIVKSDNFVESMSAIVQGALYPAVRPSDIRDYQIQVPPLAEQRRIVGKIEALQKRSRSAREALAEVGPLLEQFRQSLLAAAFRGDLTADWRAANPNVEPATELLARIRQERRQKWEKTELAKYHAKGKQPPKGWQDKYKEPEPVDDSGLGELPSSWCWASIGELSGSNGVFDGARDHGKNTPVELNLRTADYTDSGVRVIRLENLHHLEFDDTKNTFISNEKFVGLKQRGIEENDILIGSFVADSMRLSLPPESIVGMAVCKADVFTLRVVEDLIVPRFVLLMLGSPDVFNRYVSFARGVTRPRINTCLLNETPIPLCRLEEQEEIIRQVHEALECVYGLKSVLDSSESDLTELDQSILAKAFRGELVPQDPSDEPASVLLERIREARESEPQKQKKAKKKSPPKRKAAVDV